VFESCKPLTRGEADRALHWNWAEGDWPGVTSLMHPAALPMRVWTAWMLALTLSYVAFLEPIMIAYNSNITSSSTTALVDLIAGAAFAIDVVVSFRSGIYYLYDGHVRLILDGNTVAREYLSRYFIVDFLSALPFFVQCGYMLFVAVTGVPPHIHGWAITALRILRLMRVVRLYKLFSSRRAILGAEVLVLQRSGSPLLMFTASVLYWFGFIVNLMACAFIFTATVECFCDSWVNQLAEPPVDGALLPLPADGWCGASGSVCEATGLQLPSGPSIYVTSLYFSTMTLTTVGYGDIVAKTMAEKLVVILFMLLSAFFVAAFTARIIEVLAKHGEEGQAEQVFKDKMVDADVFVRDYKLGPEEQREVLHWVQAAYMPHEKHGAWRNALLGELPVHMRASAIAHMTDLRHEAFEGISKTTWQWMVGRMRPFTLHAGHYVAVEGDECTSLFFTASGALALIASGAARLRLGQLRGVGRCVGGALAARALRAAAGGSEQPPPPLRWPVSVQTLVESELFELTHEQLVSALRLGGASGEELESLAATLEARDDLTIGET